MAEENKPSLVGSMAGSVASGVYEGVKGAVIGGAVGAIAGTVDFIPDSLATKIGEAVQEKIPSTSVAATIGATVGAASGLINGVINNTTRADRELLAQNIDEESKINQVAAGLNMLGMALANTQQALMDTQQQVGAVGKFTEKLLKERANPNAAVELANKPQVGSFTAKENARGHDGAHLGHSA